LDRGTAFLAMAALGALTFIFCSPSLFGVLSAGVAYDTSVRVVYKPRVDILIPFQTQYLYPAIRYWALSDFASLPRTNYTVRGSASGNSSFTILILDSAGYTNLVGGVPYTPVLSVISASGENRTFRLHLDQSRTLHLVIVKPAGQSTAVISLVIYFEYYQETIETTSTMSVTKTIILPAASLIGLVVLIFSFVNLRRLARQTREEAERRELYMYVPGEAGRSGPGRSRSAT